MGIKGIGVLEIVLHIDIGEASPRNTKSTNHYKKLHIEIYYPSRFFPPFWLDIDDPKEIDITEPDG
jgi:hypothetical protein